MKNMRKMLIAACFVLLLCPQLAANASASAAVVYTQFTSGNSTHSGTGTQSNPYNLFEDALDAVADGGTIYIQSGFGFVNAQTDDPLVIDKKVTIAADPSAGYATTLEVRTGGVVLGADVTFSNVKLAFSNTVRPVICANGYALTLDNVTCDTSAGQGVIHVAGGSMYDLKAGKTLSPKSGGHSVVTIQGKNTKLGNIYAGSINTSFGVPVDIIVDDVPSAGIGSIYASGAQEGKPPTEGSYQASGGVSITLTNAGSRTVDGYTGGDANAALTVRNTTDSTHYGTSSGTVSDLASLTVTDGTYAPTGLDGNVAVTVEADGVLDLSGSSDCAISSFTGNGGKLRLSAGGSLTILDSSAGTATLDFSWTPASYDHQYLWTVGQANFSFVGYGSQSMTLNPTANGWRTSAQKKSSSVQLTQFEIASDMKVSEDDMLSSEGVSIPVTATFTEDSTVESLGMVSLRGSITYDGTQYGPWDFEEDDDGYYDLIVWSLGIWIVPDDDEIKLFCSDTGESVAGVYVLEFTAPTTSGNVTQTVTLTVGDAAPKPMWTVSRSGDKVAVTFRNQTGSDVVGGVMVAAAYQNGQLAALRTAAVNAGQDGRADHTFDFSGVTYDQVGFYLCDGLSSMKPLCGGYSWTP